MLEDRYIDPYLPYFIHSHIKLKERWPDLWQFVDAVYGNSTNIAWRQRLEQDFLAELALVAITRDDFDRARYYSNQFYGQFLTKWASLHPLSLAGRHSQLQRLQKIVELEEFLEFVRDDEQVNFASSDKLESLLSKWHVRWPSSRFDNINVWDDITANRALLLEKLNERFSNYWATELDKEMGTDRMEEDDDEEIDSTPLPSGVKKEPGTEAVTRNRSGGKGFRALQKIKGFLLKEREDIYRQMAVGARKLSNFYVADLYMKLSLKAQKSSQARLAIASSDQDEFNFPFFHSLVKLYCLKAR